jgi:hypothetical protein
MAKTTASRSGRLADEFEATLDGFIGVVEGLTTEQWRLRGRNTPGQRINNEDEARPLGVIAHHVAVNQDVIMGRIQMVLHDKPTPPVDFKAINAKHANEYADTTKAEVVTMLRETGRQISKELRAIPDAKLDAARDLPSGRMTVQDRIERVLIGHIKSHQGSIEATIS